MSELGAQIQNCSRPTCQRQQRHPQMGCRIRDKMAYELRPDRSASEVVLESQRRIGPAKRRVDRPMFRSLPTTDTAARRTLRCSPQGCRHRRRRLRDRVPRCLPSVASSREIASHPPVRVCNRCFVEKRIAMPGYNSVFVTEMSCYGRGGAGQDAG